MTNIGKDLSHYYKFLTNQPDPEKLLGPTVLLSLRELMEVRHYTIYRFMSDLCQCHFITICSNTIQIERKMLLCVLLDVTHLNN